MSLLWQSAVMNFNKTLLQAHQVQQQVTCSPVGKQACNWSLDDSLPLPGSPLCTSTPKRKEPLGSSFEPNHSESYESLEDAKTVFGSKKFSKAVRNAISSKVAAALDMSDVALDETNASLPDISHSCCSVCDQSEFLDSDLRDTTYNMVDLPLWNDESLLQGQSREEKKKNAGTPKSLQKSKSLREKLKKIGRKLYFKKEVLRMDILTVV